MSGEQNIDNALDNADNDGNINNELIHNTNVITVEERKKKRDSIHKKACPTGTYSLIVLVVLFVIVQKSTDFLI